MTRDAPNPFARPGVTLIELIVVVTLLAVAAGVIVPRFGGSLAPIEVREAAGRFAQTAQLTQELAVARQQEFTIEVDLAAKAYQVLMPASDSSSNERRAVRRTWLRGARFPEGIEIDEYRTADGVRATGGTQRITFRPDGTTSGAALQLVARAAIQRIVVHAHSGRVVWGDPRQTAFLPEQMDLGD